MRALCLMAFLLAPTVVFAQQQPSQITPAELAISIDSGVNQLATAATNLLKQEAADRQTIAALKKQIEELKAASPVAEPSAKAH